MMRGNERYVQCTVERTALLLAGAGGRIERMMPPKSGDPGEVLSNKKGGRRHGDGLMMGEMLMVNDERGTGLRGDGIGINFRIFLEIYYEK